MRIVFMGTPLFAVPCLRRLVEDGHEIIGVYTKPDMPKNRGMKVEVTPVKEYALSQSIPVFQPQGFKLESDVADLAALAPELIVVVAYGVILPQSMLDIPVYGCINVHASILPKYRGAAPIQRAVLDGEKETGLTTMRIIKELDAGDIIDIIKTEIGEYETSGELTLRLSALGGELISKTVRDIESGKAIYTPQQHDNATYAHMLTKDMSPIDWSLSAAQIISQIRGLIPWPVATADIAGAICKVYEARKCDYTTNQLPGHIVKADKDGIDFACGGGEVIRISSLQAPGGKRMTAADYLRGHPIDIKN